MRFHSVPASEGQSSPARGRSSGTLKIAILIIAIIGVAAFSEVLSYYYPDTSSPTAYLVTIKIPDGAAKSNGSVSFSPATVTVVLGINNTVQWINLDKTPNAVHTVIFTQVPANANITAASLSSSISPGIIYDTYYGPVLLPAPGVYLYHCHYHPWMTGTIIVKP